MTITHFYIKASKISLSVLILVLLSCTAIEKDSHVDIVNILLKEMKCSDFNATYKLSDSCTASISKTFIGEPIGPDRIKLENFDYDSFYKNSELLKFDIEISRLNNTEIEYKIYPIDSIKYSGNGDILENFHFRKYQEYDNYINGITISNPRYQKKGSLDRYLFQVNGFLEYKTRPLFYLIEKDKYKKQLTLTRLITFIPRPPD